MDKRFMKGRLALVALIAVLCIAIPAAAFAASSNTYPSGSTAQPSVVGVTFTGVGGNSAVVTIDGTAVSSNIAKGTSVTGTWNVQSVLVGAVFKTQWVWTAGTGVDGQIKVYGFPTTLANGAHTVVATLKDGNGVVTDSATWTFTIDSTIPTGGSDLPGTIVAAPECGAVCHPNYNKKPAMGPKCSACHYGADAPDPAVHSFDQGNASGHNTPMYGRVGAFTKWDGSEGVTVKDSAGNTIAQEWPLPTSGVFWSQTLALNSDGTVAGNVSSAKSLFSLNPTDAPEVAMDFRGFSSGTAGAAAINKSVGWGSVVSCTDCHSNMNEALGPQGANAGQVSLDPNFPDDWTRAEITSFDPTGMRSIETTRGPQSEYGKTVTPYNPYYGMWGGNVNMNAYSISGPKNVGGPNVEIKPGGFYSMGQPSSNGYSAASGPAKRFICQKCHKLTNSFQGLGIEGNGRGFRSNNANYMGFSNEAHMEHHADMVTGQGNCVSCHIAIPHGWKRPRLLVYESDPAPYKKQWVFSYYQTKGTAATANSVNGQATDLGATIPTFTPGTGYDAQTKQGNWGWAGYGSGSLSNPYSVIGAAIPDAAVGTTITPNTTKNFAGQFVNVDGSVGVGIGGTYPDGSINTTTFAITNGLDTLPQNTLVSNAGKTYSTHLERINANDTALKELAVGPAESYASNDAFNGTTWGLWAHDANGFVAEGSEWIPDTSANALYPGEAIQNNCTACTSAGTTHSDTGGTSEGVADTNRPGRAPWSGAEKFINGAEYHDSSANTGTWTQVPYWK